MIDGLITRRLKIAGLRWCFKTMPFSPHLTVFENRIRFAHALNNLVLKSQNACRMYSGTDAHRTIAETPFGELSGRHVNVWLLKARIGDGT